MTLKSSALITLLLLVLAAAPSLGRGATLTEYQVKAAFIFNFAKFIEWPPGAFPGEKAPYVLGVMGQNPFGKLLEQMTSGKEVNGRPFIVKRLDQGQNFVDCHILFISSSESAKLKSILNSVRGAPVVTVSDIPGFGSQGGTIRLFLAGRKVRFEINAGAASSSNIKVSSQLLKLSQASGG